MSKVEVFVRHCHFSEVSQHKNRPAGFSREKCYRNLLATCDPQEVNFTFLLDAYHPAERPHFLTQESVGKLVVIKEGSETGSFLRLLEHVKALRLKPETVIYFLEDDYLHRPGWVEVLREGLSLPGVSYVTLFDHRDKYFDPRYSDLTSTLYHTESCHWRTTPSTTNTYAMRFQTLLEDYEMHVAFSTGRRISADHEKFLRLGEEGRRLISSVPGWSTHVETEFLSPCVSWQF